MGSNIIIRSPFYITGGAKSDALIFLQPCRKRLAKKIYCVVLLLFFLLVKNDCFKIMFQKFASANIIAIYIK